MRPQDIDILGNKMGEKVRIGKLHRSGLFLKASIVFGARRVEWSLPQSCIMPLNRKRSVTPHWNVLLRLVWQNLEELVRDSHTAVQEQLTAEGFYATYGKVGARTEMPGCSLCMGNQARVADGCTVVSTSTRNFPNRLGKGHFGNKTRM